jgi:hypothetical protein
MGDGEVKVRFSIAGPRRLPSSALWLCLLVPDGSQHFLYCNFTVGSRHSAVASSPVPMRL